MYASSVATKCLSHKSFSNGKIKIKLHITLAIPNTSTGNTLCIGNQIHVAHSRYIGFSTRILFVTYALRSHSL